MNMEVDEKSNWVKRRAKNDETLAEMDMGKDERVFSVRQTAFKVTGESEWRGERKEKRKMAAKEKRRDEGTEGR